MSWLRLDAAWRRDARCIRAGDWGRRVFLAALEMAKEHRWRGGKIPRAEFDEYLIGMHLLLPVTDSHGDVTPVTRDIRDGILACIRVGLLIPRDGDGNDVDTDFASVTDVTRDIPPEVETLQVRSWSKHQSDPTATDRKRRQRKREKSRKSRGRHDVTPKSESESEGLPPKPPKGGGSTSSPPGTQDGKPLTNRQWVAVGAILDHLATGALTQQHAKRAIEDRALFREGELPEGRAREVWTNHRHRCPQAIKAAQQEARHQRAERRRRQA